MNRIYQGRITGVTLADGASLINWTDKLWDHHVLFQDAVNYYIIALAALSTSGQGKLADLLDKLRGVWDQVEKPGEFRPGMRLPLATRFAIPVQDFILERAIELIRDGGFPDPIEAEKYGQYVLGKASGSGAIRNAAREFLPHLCDPAAKVNLPGGGADEQKAIGFERLQTELHNENLVLAVFASECRLDWVVKLTRNADPFPVKDRIRKSIHHFLKAFRSELNQKKDAELACKTRQWLRTQTDAQSILEGLLVAEIPFAEIPRNNKGVADRTEALLLFKYFPQPFTHELLKFLFPKPLPSVVKKNKIRPKALLPEVDGARARGQRGYVFRAFTTFAFMGGGSASDFISSGWGREFDIAAFKEALTVVNQFSQNLEKRVEKIMRLAARLLLMAGNAAVDDVSDVEAKSRIQSMVDKTPDDLEKLSAEKNDHEEPDASFWASFSNDSRIPRLRQIISQELVDENDGRPYGLRERTIKGWGKVFSAWRRVAKGHPFSEIMRVKLQSELDKLRQDHSEEIGSRLLFEALIVDEEAWAIWRNPNDDDLLDRYRRYCETLVDLESCITRQINLTPADPVRSRRLFSFTDACSFGNKKGEFKHDSELLAVIVPLAIADANGHFKKCAVRLNYSAPRLLRDRLRSNEGKYIKTWVQPLADALWGNQGPPAQPDEKLDGAAVELMPDRDRNDHRRFLLNFSLELSADALSQRVREIREHANLPAGFNIARTGKWYLPWPNESGDAPKQPWWDNLKSFSALGVDLGVRQAAAAAYVEIKTDFSSGRHARFIGEASGKRWSARYCFGSLLRLPGEDCKVWRKASKKDPGGASREMAFREELGGSRGRTATAEETRDAINLINSLVNSLGYSERAADLNQASFPQQNDKLLVAIRCKQRQMARENRWLWMLAVGSSEQKMKTRADIEKVAPELALDPSVLLSLRARVNNARILIQHSILAATERILPVRGRNWEWVEYEDQVHFPNCRRLRLTGLGTGSVQKKLAGQRGLSMSRIGQLLDLRRRWQSLNQSLRRQPGAPPLTAAEMRQHSIPDPCPDILRKLDQIREQRVNQTAHQILAEALGVRLRPSNVSHDDRVRADRHGQYESFRPPVDLIVIENLSRYRASQGRAHHENSRLMQWCHRQVAHKLVELAEPFGIPVLNTPAAYSSRFCSLTGVVGFRAIEVASSDRGKFRWRRLLHEADSQGVNASEEAQWVTELFRRLDELNHGRDKGVMRTLLAPQSDGPIFVRAVAGPHEFMQADLNAAINLVFRAIAAPDRFEFHHRIRTVRKRAGIYATKAYRCEVQSVVFDSELTAAYEFPNIFPDPEGIAKFHRARLGNEESCRYATWPALNQGIGQICWARCDEINQARIKNWWPVSGKAVAADIPF